MVFRLFRRRDEGPRPPARAPEGTRIYAVGDIHGRRDLLDALHALIIEDWREHDAERGIIVYVGDYIDRGSDSRGVIEALLAPAPAGLERCFLKGNHEQMLEQFLADPAAGKAWRHLGGLETMLSYGVDIGRGVGDEAIETLAPRLAERLPESHRQFLDALQPSVRFGDYFFCHAGVRPGVPLDQQAQADLLWIRTEFLNSRADHGAVVVHGHSPTDQVELRANRINVDTGAYATGHLSCIVLSGEDRRILST